LLDIHLETGRTHQIRVHMAAVRHPCVGDLTYGADPVLAKRLGLGRQWLHARELGFEHPATGAELRIASPFPADLQRALDLLRAES
jgi:23S rRNA pseudouridine1911/1915/1917 synthase